MAKDFSLGGLKMPDFATFVKSIKLSWLKNLLSEEKKSWHLIIENNLTVDLNYFLNSPFLVSDIPISLPPFYKQILTYAAEIPKICPSEISVILNQNIFFNRFITVKKNTIFIKTWFQKGIKKISDILDEGSSLFLTIPQLATKFAFTINLIDYYNIKSSLPKSWKEAINAVNILHIPAPDSSQTALPIYQKSNMYYTLLISQIASFAPGPSKLSKELNVDINIIFRSLVQIRSFTKNTKYIMMQFKIIHRILACNEYLHTTKIRRNPICDYCKETDSIEHHLFSCGATLQFWQSLINWYNDIRNFNILLTYKTVILGPNPKKHLLASLVFHGKWFIYTSKLNSSPIDLKNFKMYLKRELRIEKMGILSNSSNKRLTLFNNTWNDIL